jgi:hypothetical protein
MLLDEALNLRSIFHFLHDPYDLDRENAISFFEQESKEKYDDLLGYCLLSLHRSVSQQDFANLEIRNVNALLNTGTCQLMTGYDDFYNLAQIPLCNEQLVSSRWADFISISDYQNYAEAQEAWQKNFDLMIAEGDEDDRFFDMPTMNLERFFSTKWIVATQVQALNWYKEFLHYVAIHGHSFEADEKPAKNGKSPQGTKYSCGNNSIHKVIDKAFYELYETGQKTMPMDVLDKIYNEYIYGKSNATKIKTIDVKGIIITCAKRLINEGKVIEWKTTDGKKATLSKTQFSKLVKNLNDAQKS